MNKYKDKLTFVEFVAKDSENSIEWVENYIGSFLKNGKIHDGDCVKNPCVCYLCTIQNLLEDYEKYFFGDKE
jgi:hypothetical protein